MVLLALCDWQFLREINRNWTTLSATVQLHIWFYIVLVMLYGKKDMFCNIRCHLVGLNTQSVLKPIVFVFFH